MMNQVARQEVRKENWLSTLIAAHRPLRFFRLRRFVKAFRRRPEVGLCSNSGRVRDVLGAALKIADQETRVIRQSSPAPDASPEWIASQFIFDRLGMSPP